MERNINPCECGSLEFITKPNQYDVYEIIDKKLEFVKSILVEEEEKLYCRDCSKKLVLREE
jgi:hypothetical protein